MSLFVILTPLQTWFMKLSFKVRQSSMVSICTEYNCESLFLQLLSLIEMDRWEVKAFTGASIVDGDHKAVYV